MIYRLILIVTLFFTIIFCENIVQHQNSYKYEKIQIYSSSSDENFLISHYDDESKKYLYSRIVVADKGAQNICNLGLFNKDEIILSAMTDNSNFIYTFNKLCFYGDYCSKIYEKAMNISKLISFGKGYLVLNKDDGYVYYFDEYSRIITSYHDFSNHSDTLYIYLKRDEQWYYCDFVYDYNTKNKNAIFQCETIKNEDFEENSKVFIFDFANIAINNQSTAISIVNKPAFGFDNYSINSLYFHNSLLISNEQSGIQFYEALQYPKTFAKFTSYMNESLDFSNIFYSSKHGKIVLITKEATSLEIFSIKSCENNHYLSKNSQCVHCRQGMFSFTGLSCQRCLPNSISTTIGCKACIEGYGSFMDQSECQCCPKGYFSTPTTNCTRCIGNTFASSKCSTKCVACPTGTYANEDKTGCVKCADNAIATKMGCVVCPMGFEANLNTGSCEACSNGHYSSIKTNYRCQSCDKRSVAPFTSMSTCLECPMYQAADFSNTLCLKIQNKCIFPFVLNPQTLNCDITSWWQISIVLLFVGLLALFIWFMVGYLKNNCKKNNNFDESEGYLLLA
eukprot:TRINITY_DN553_c0_g1_i1.p1 TRINITY_DN553_c0_g1~~TRINITY_DN553_c0_g1_i1.p1  ORF type:complete len:564 (-),score=119.38 TRINITY_DN553_c0_g1_i1:52-1743(-)